jgi:hypothetical protein
MLKILAFALRGVMKLYKQLGIKMEAAAKAVIAAASLPRCHPP